MYLCQEDGQDAENNDDYLYLSRWADSGLSINFEAEGSISVKDGDTSLFAWKILPERRISMLKKPITTEDLFDKIKCILQEKDKLPDILDYGLGRIVLFRLKPMNST